MIQCVCLADDMALLADTEKMMKDMIKKLDKAC